jgi:ubiquinone/menaquinone biosynthesis C-methylase UbiE
MHDERPVTKELPLPSSKDQFMKIWKKHNHLFPKILRFAMAGPPAYNKPALQNQLKDIVANGCEKQEDDVSIYQKMRALVFPEEKKETIQDQSGSLDVVTSEATSSSSLKSKRSASLEEKKQVEKEAEKVTEKEENQLKKKKPKEEDGINNYNTSVFNTSALLSRAERRAKEIVNLLPTVSERPIRFDTLLDVGGSEGSITGALAKELGIELNKAISADVTMPMEQKQAEGEGEEKDISTSHGVRFQLLESNQPLPFENASFAVVTCLMCLHHVDNQLLMLKELHRVLKPGGMLVIREHDLDDSGMFLVIDIMHGMYDLVWSQPPQNPQFVQEYKALYRSKSKWRSMASEAGFLVPYPERNPRQYGAHSNAQACNAYFDLFKKPLKEECSSAEKYFDFRPQSYRHYRGGERGGGGYGERRGNYYHERRGNHRGYKRDRSRDRQDRRDYHRDHRNYRRQQDNSSRHRPY